MVTEILSTFLSDPMGIFVMVIFGLIAVAKAYQANDKSEALNKTLDLLAELKAAFDPHHPSVIVPDSLKDEPKFWKMPESVWEVIKENLPALEATKLRNVIYEKEGSTPPILYYKLATSKGVYEISQGRISGIEPLDIPCIGAVTFPGRGEIFRIWGGFSASAGNVPQTQPEEIVLDELGRSVFVSTKALQPGGVTIGMFADGVAISKKLVQYSAQDAINSEVNVISFPTFHTAIPKEVISKAMAGNKGFELTVAIVSGGKWFYEGDQSIIPWDDQQTVHVKVL